VGDTHCGFIILDNASGVVLQALKGRICIQCRPSTEKKKSVFLKKTVIRSLFVSVADCLDYIEI